MKIHNMKRTMNVHIDCIRSSKIHIIFFCPAPVALKCTKIQKTQKHAKKHQTNPKIPKIHEKIHKNQQNPQNSQNPQNPKNPPNSEKIQQNPTKSQSLPTQILPGPTDNFLSIYIFRSIYMFLSIYILSFERKL